MSGTHDAELAELIELLSRRHTLSIVLFLRGGPQPFGALVAHVGANPPQVTQRARELREAGVVEIDEGGDYRLSGTGRRLLGALDGLGRFAAEWASLSPRQRSPRGAATYGRGEPSG